MKKHTYFLKALLLFLLPAANLFAQQGFKLEEKFNNSAVKYDKVGRGLTKVEKGTLTTKDAYLNFGESNWADYEVKFDAKVPATAKEVQICAGFHAANRDDRYILMLRGGIQKFLYLARLGYMGADDYLALRELDFQPIPGKWYNFRIQVAGGRIRVFMGNEALPRIDIIDKASNMAPAGKVTLGGSWITNEFDNLSITSINKNDILNLPVKEYAKPPIDKEALRKQQRANYQPINISAIGKNRTEISLDGNWLFSPDYETSDDAKAVSPNDGDTNWHIMNVPDFWNPIRVWLHGERYNSGSKGVADNYYQKETDRCEAYTFDYKKTNSAWYRQWVQLPANIKGKHLELTFDAISKVSEVWVNGTNAGSHIGMFGEFKIDVSNLLKPGKNLIAVKVGKNYVKNIKDANKIVDVAVSVEVTEKMLKDLAHGMFGDDPGGIWQPVKLTITDPVKIEDVFIRSNLTGADIDVTVKNYGSAVQSFSLSTTINGTQIKETLYKDISLKQVELQEGEEKTFTYTISGLKPKLWSPEHPNLYDFDFALLTANGKQVIDYKNIRSGFRTFKAAGDYFYLNGKQYWLRGANQSAMPLAPNDSLLADKFSRLMHDGNIAVSRSHTVPYNELWLNASDKNGVGISYEGTWTWLFLQSSMPDMKLVDLWKNEFYGLIKKYRNHPSLLLWTVNNEMKFYDNDPDIARAKVKMKIISDVVKHMRVIDPTRSIVFDSNYRRNTKRFGDDFYKDIDDGDIDDVHAYINWYNFSLFDYFNGEWQKKFKNPGRPLISQELSTGYADETGHPTRFYNYVHQTSSALIGKYGYEYNDPYYFLKIEAFNTKELAEALRRSDDKAAGILHFSLATWFTNIYLVNKVTPFPAYYEVKKALQPVLVSAELWGRHFYAGAPLSTRICVVNDKEDGTILPASTLQWQIVGKGGIEIAEGKLAIPAVAHYGREWVSPKITIPQNLPAPRVDGKLLLTLVQDGKTVSENSYDVLLMSKAAINANTLSGNKIAVLDLNKTISPSLDYLGVKYNASSSLADLLKQKADVYILSGLDSLNTDATATKQIRQLISGGANVLVSRSGNFSHQLYPEYIRGTLKSNGEVMSMDIPESGIFNGLEPLDTRLFTNNKREMPAVISGAFRITRNPKLEAPASFTKVHAYLPGQSEERVALIDGIRGYPIVKIKDGGNAILSELLVEKATTDPVAAKLLVNMLKELTK